MSENITHKTGTVKRYAVFDAGRQVSKPHSTTEAAATEAFGMGAVIYSNGQQFLALGWEIREIDDDL